MDSAETSLWVVIGVAFVIGYTVVGFVVNKLKARISATTPGQAPRRDMTTALLSEEQRHARVLGLSGTITAADVERAYRGLAAKYQAGATGPAGKPGSAAEIREILAACEFFRRKFNIGTSAPSSSGSDSAGD